MPSFSRSVVTVFAPLAGRGGLEPFFGDRQTIKSVDQHSEIGQSRLVTPFSPSEDVTSAADSAIWALLRFGAGVLVSVMSVALTFLE